MGLGNVSKKFKFPLFSWRHQWATTQTRGMSKKCSIGSMDPTKTGQRCVERSVIGCRGNSRWGKRERVSDRRTRHSLESRVAHMIWIKLIKFKVQPVQNIEFINGYIKCLVKWGWVYKTERIFFWKRQTNMEKAKTLWGLSLVRALRQQDLLIRGQY